MFRPSRNMLARIGGALPLSPGASPGPETKWKPECKRYKAHRWNKRCSKTGRHCTRCGFHEEWNPATQSFDPVTIKR